MRRRRAHPSVRCVLYASEPRHNGFRGGLTMYVYAVCDSGESPQSLRSSRSGSGKA